MGERERRAWLARWPAVTTDIKWGSALCFLIAGRMFCLYRLDGESRGSLSFKAGRERFLELTDRPAP